MVLATFCFVVLDSLDQEMISHGHALEIGSLLVL